MKQSLKVLVLAAGGAAAALAAVSAPAAGRFIHVDGAVNVRDVAGAVRAAKSGEALNERESVQVGEGRAQIRFDDGGWVSLQPRTVFEVKEYARREDGNIVLSLIKGGARAVTGLFSDRQPARYRMETPTATIGIRGTSFLVTFCLHSCDLPDGLYVTGGDGTIFVKNPFGEIDLSRGRTAYVASAQTPPRESGVKPVVQVEETMTAQQTAAVGSTTTAELRPGNFIYFEGTSGYTGPFQVLPVTSLGVGLAASGTISAAASGTVKGIFESGSGSVTGAGAGAGAGTISNPGDALTIILDSAQRPVSFTATGAAGERVTATALKAPELASSDGALFWGRWTGTRFQFDVQDPASGSNAIGDANLPAGSYLHYIVGVPAGSVPLTGSATYTFIGGTGSTSQLGSVGAGVTAGTLTANFGANTVGAGMTISHGGIYSASGLATLEPGERARFTSVFGLANGPSGSFPFKFEGFFAGVSAPTAPPRAGVAWTIDRLDPIVGTAAFRCVTGC
jgi:hypothetical protein